MVGDELSDLQLTLAFVLLSTFDLLSRIYCIEVDPRINGAKIAKVFLKRGCTFTKSALLVFIHSISLCSPPCHHRHAI